MTIDDLIAQVRAYTGASAAVLPDLTIAESINQAIRRLQRVHPFRGELRSIELTVPQASSSVNLPADYLNEQGVWLKDPNATSAASALTAIPKTLRRFWIETQAAPTTLRDSVFPNVQAPGAANTVTLGYYVFAGALYLVPGVTADTLVQLDYWSILPDLVAGTAQENFFTDRYPDVVRFGALADAYFFLHQWEASTASLNAFSAAARESIHQDVSDAMSGPPHQRGK